MAKFTFNDLMTIISNVFKSDIYILKYNYCIGGPESEDENISQTVCLLSPTCSNLLKEVFPDSEIVYIKDVKKIKKDFDEFISLKISDIEKENVIKQRDKVLDLIYKIENWKSFEFTDEDIEDIFINRLT